jgi:hypothetical protein
MRTLRLRAGRPRRLRLGSARTWRCRPAGNRLVRVLSAVAMATLVVALGSSMASATGRTRPPASPATRPAPRTKAQWQASIAHVRQPAPGCYRASYPALRWHATKCVTAPRVPLVPAPLLRSARHAGPAKHAGPAQIGNGYDYSTQVSGLISQATGTFQDVSSGVTEQGDVDGSGPLTANSYTLQINSQTFTGSPACDGSSEPADCQAWQQFVYQYESPTVSDIFIEYWLLSYDASCPSGWSTASGYSGDCYINSLAATVSTLTAAQLATVQLTGSAKSGGNDSVSLSVGSGQATSVSNSDSVVGLASYWNTTEWGVFGQGDAVEAYFGSGTTLQAQTALTTTSSSAPYCISQGFTGETNNLSLTSTPTLGSESSPTMASSQTNGTTGTAGCSVSLPGGNPPAVAITGSGTADVFWKGIYGGLEQAIGSATGALTEYNLGDGPLGSAPAAGVDSSGNAYVYWDGANQDLYETYWNGSAWVGPYNRGLGSLASPPAVTITGSGTADVFWESTSGNLEQALGPATGALTLYNRGDGPLGSAPAAGVDSSGNAYVYWEGTNQDLYETYWNGSAWVGPDDRGLGPLG